MSANASGIRTVSVSESDVASVRVSVGYSTLLQFDSRPTQAIIGDQDAFKVEYVGNALAIKPLTNSARTNLFVATQTERFNFRISSGQGFEPDYVVRVRRKALESISAVVPSLKAIRLNRVKEERGMRVTLESVAKLSNGAGVILSFQVRSKDKVRTFEPGGFEVIQAGRSLPIENIYLDRLVLGPGETLRGMMVVRGSNIKTKQRLAIRVVSVKPIATVQVFAPGF